MYITYQENTLTVQQYLDMERLMGDVLTTKPQAERAIAHQLYSVSAYDGAQLVGIARLVGDAAIYWYVQDVWVLPAYQRKGIGSAMMRLLIDHVYRSSLPGTNVSLCLMCAKDKEPFYEKLGFAARPHAWEGAGMEMELDIPEETP